MTILIILPFYHYVFICYWNTYIKTNFSHHLFGHSELQFLQERQDTCVTSFQNNKLVPCILQQQSVTCVLWGFLMPPSECLDLNL